jgi:DNA polymerase-3 subunit epsilon
MTDIRRVAIIDTETSDLDSSAELIEIGIILYSITNQTSLVEFSTLISPLHGNRAEAVNRISQAALREIATMESESLLAINQPTDDMIRHLLRSADALVSYNVEFDARFFDPHHFAGAQHLGEFYIDWPWLCAMSDFKWPHANRQQGSLIHLALDEGIGISTAHRALTDCRILAELFNRASELPAMLDFALRPKAMFQSHQSFDDNHLAKAAGFKWERDGAPRKSWTRIMAIDDVAELPFRTELICHVSHSAKDWVATMRARAEPCFGTKAAAYLKGDKEWRSIATTLEADRTRQFKWWDYDYT